MKKRENIPNLQKFPCGEFKGLVFLFVFLLFSGCQNDRPHLPFNRLPTDYTTDNLLVINKVLAERELEEIEAFVQQSDFDFTESPLGFWYNIEFQGDGRPIKRGNRVRVEYDLILLDETLCYERERTINIGRFEITRGLDEALFLLNEGGRGTFIIPSGLAFGIIGDQNCVGAKRTIIYKILTVEIVR